MKNTTIKYSDNFEWIALTKEQSVKALDLGYPVFALNLDEETEHLVTDLDYFNEFEDFGIESNAQNNQIFQIL
jgi:hypothetical protein